MALALALASIRAEATPFVETIGGPALDAFEGVLPLPSGGVIGVGWTRSTAATQEDGWLKEGEGV